MIPTRLVNQQAPHVAHTPLLGWVHIQAVGGTIQISAVFRDNYVLRGTFIEAA